MFLSLTSNSGVREPQVHTGEGIERGVPADVELPGIAERRRDVFMPEMSLDLLDEDAISEREGRHGVPEGMGDDSSADLGFLHPVLHDLHGNPHDYTSSYVQVRSRSEQEPDEWDLRGHRKSPLLVETHSHIGGVDHQNDQRLDLIEQKGVR